MIRDGRSGKLTKATCAIGGAPRSPELPVAQPPGHFDWNMWQGPVSEVEYRVRHGDEVQHQIGLWRRSGVDHSERRRQFSDVFSHHRALSTCHLAGIAARFNRKIQWDPSAERIVSDDQAQGLVAREKRNGFEIEM